MRAADLRGPVLGTLLGLAISVALLAAASLGLFQPIEWMALDALFLLRARFAPEPREHVVTVIALDELAMQSFGTWPWPRNIQAGIIEFVLEAEPSVLGIALVYSEFSSDSRHDLELAEAIAGEIPVVLAAVKEGGSELLPQVAFLAPNVSVGHLNAPPDADGIVRRIPLEIETRDGRVSAFAWKMAEKALEAAQRGEAPAEEEAQAAGPQPPPVDSQGRFLINYLLRGGSPALDTAALALTVPVTDVIEGRDLERVRGKPAILAVTAAGGGASEERLTALRPLGPVPQAYIHASALAALLEGAHLRTDPELDALLLLALGPLAGALAFGLRPWRFTLALATLACAFAGFTFEQFVVRGRVVAVTPPLAALFLLYFTGLWYAHRRVEGEARKVRATFQRYVTPEVVDALLSQPDAAELKGGRRRVTVLFADLRGFTAFAERMSPEHVVQVLNRYLAAMADAVLQRGGMVDKFLGDGLMALFGAPLPDEGHADAAVQAALDMLHRTRELSQPGAGDSPASSRRSAAGEAAGLGEPPPEPKLSVGIGIHTGEVIVGSIGSPKRLEYTAVGDTVNVAARLQELAEPGSIVLSKGAVEALSSELRTLAEPMPPAVVRGRTEPVALFRITPSVLEGSSVESPGRPSEAEGPSEPGGA